MEFIKNFLKGQKLFILDLFALVDFILLSLAYLLGVGLAIIFFKKERKIKQKNTFWVVSDLTTKDTSSFLSQF